MVSQQFFLTHLYCSRCMAWRNIEEVKWVNGSPKCDRCGNTLRIKPRKYRRQNPKLLQKKLEIIEQYRWRKEGGKI